MERQADEELARSSRMEETWGMGERAWCLVHTVNREFREWEGWRFGCELFILICRLLTFNL
jgi:hypothetical protein